MGSLPTDSSTRKDIPLALEGRYVPEPNSGCWLWVGAISTEGYPVYNGKYIHRAVARSRPGQDTRHLCSVRCCVRPDHLVPGTRKENMQDMVRAGRSRRGSDAPGALLTDTGAAEAKRRLKSGESQSKVAARLGVARTTIAAIAQGRTWTHVHAG